MQSFDFEEIFAYLRPYWGWLGLSILLIGLVVWLQNPLTPVEPTPPISIILPPTLKATSSPTATPGHFAPLVDSEGKPILEATPLPSATVTPTPTPLFIFHSIKPGETLISIAAKYGVTTEALLAANDIRDPTKLDVGKDLLIPPHEGLRAPIVPHTVEQGDTLLSIALKYGSSVKDIIAANPRLDLNSLKAGETLAVPVVFNETRPISAPANSGEPVYYTIVEGDTPLAIAQEYNIPVELLLAANDITDPTLLQIGRQLLIPPNEGLTQGVPIILYDLEKGDTLLELASKFGSSVKDILAVNPKLIPSNLEANQTVAIPIVFAPPRPTPTPQTVHQGTPIPIAPPPGLVEMEQQMADGVNAERAKAGLLPYEIDQEITAMALAHAQDMVIRGYFGHITPEGITLRDRFAQAKIKAINVGEDIQRNTRPAQESVQFALDWFMNSRPHRANILHPRHNRIGVGIVEEPPGWFTFVLVFAQR